ncbi:LysR family transcriptional regulator [Uliginosibacterium sp. 31-12]|uniref:LysR family transcriptional regulator n=1 Tax=Uliginosibacterium sp. 31-12 TaxID=3062781 RepID=UPI0026E13B19|nr:LysR family transcriptional regulator [Uliginosibacterium sp. 31-12]MDO6387547.1 LysR family transcriptional regulator [Uliginosibacterium sp. 31-12]
MNYKHLHYFWKVASCGGVLRAAEALNTTPQTVSGQIKLLEERLGKALFRKDGRKLALTEAGRMALGYAEEIFSLGSELQEQLASEAAEGMPMEFRVGISDAIPNAVAERLLEPVLAMDVPVRTICREWRIDRLLSELALHRLDLVLADTPVPQGLSVKAWSHRLGASKMGFFARPELAERCREQPFPQRLHAMPLLLLGEDSAVSSQFRQWASMHKIRPRIVAEFDDAGMLAAFGGKGRGIFPAPMVLKDMLCQQLGVELIGVAEGIEQACYAITVQKRISHPCAEAIVRTAREGLYPLD